MCSSNAKNQQISIPQFQWWRYSAFCKACKGGKEVALKTYYQNDLNLKHALVCRLKWCQSFILCNKIFWNWSRNARCKTIKSFQFFCCSDFSFRPVSFRIFLQYNSIKPLTVLASSCMSDGASFTSSTRMEIVFSSDLGGIPSSVTLTLMLYSDLAS